MADRINGFGGSGLDINAGRNRAVDKGDSTNAASKTPSQPPVAQSADAVDLSVTATNLKRIEADLKSVPEVNQERVDAVRERLSAGTYEVDAERVAQRLTQLDQSLLS